MPAICRSVRGAVESSLALSVAFHGKATRFAIAVSRLGTARGRAGAIAGAKPDGDVRVGTASCDARLAKRTIWSAIRQRRHI
ncbi:hypothetical protein WT12_03215 [Burkholderia territorii]|nr:hypothetical protein WT12_03215 [Burkholderia territorii]